VRTRPLTTTGVVAAITMFLAREPLLELAGKVVDGVTEKRQARKTGKIQRRRPSRQVSTEKAQ
jgi:hypothetical protein